MNGLSSLAQFYNFSTVRNAEQVRLNFFSCCNLLSYIRGEAIAFANWAVEVHRLNQCLHKNIWEEGHLRCMSVGFPFVPCLSMKHVAHGRRGFYLLHAFCLCWSLLFDCEDTFPLQAQQSLHCHWKMKNRSDFRQEGVWKNSSNNTEWRDTKKEWVPHNTSPRLCFVEKNLKALPFLCPVLKCSVVFSNRRKCGFFFWTGKIRFCDLISNVPFCAT